MTDNETKKKTKTNASKRKKKNETTQEEKWVLGKKQTKSGNMANEKSNNIGEKINSTQKGCIYMETEMGNRKRTVLSVRCNSRPSSHLCHIRHVLLLFYIYFVLSLCAITLSLHKSICSVCVNSENVGR